MFTAEDFKFIEGGKLICPAGIALYIRSRNFYTGRGYKGINYKAPVTACRNCNLRAKCLRNKNTVSRQVYILDVKNGGNITDKMMEKIDSPEGRKTYGKRLGIIEPVFANIRARKRMDHFTLRSRIKVNIQWLLFCMVHNIEKVANYGTRFAEGM